MVPRRPRVWPSTLGVVFTALSVGCVGGEKPRRATGAGETVRPPAAAPARAGNADPRGVKNQPDWDRMAAELRVQVDPRLPRPLPTERDVACDRMFEAVDRFYADTEPDPDRQAKRADELAGTRAADRAACVEHSSSEVTACVAVLAADGTTAGSLLSPLGRVLADYEFAWMLDQCSRAYPS